MNTPSSPTHRLLIVDDEPVTSTLLKHTFEKIGLTVQTANNGRECLEKVKQFAPDLILLDIIMPEMDGLDTCRQLKAMSETINIPVIFLTTRAGKRHRIIGLRLGAVDYISKPIDLGETVARVQNQLRIQDMYRENAKVQQQLAEIKQQGSVSAAARDMSHQFNNLIGVVSGYSELLPAHKDKPEQFEKMLKAMQEAIGRMKKLSQELGELSARSQSAEAAQRLSSASGQKITLN